MTNILPEIDIEFKKKPTERREFKKVVFDMCNDPLVLKKKYYPTQQMIQYLNQHLKKCMKKPGYKEKLAEVYGASNGVKDFVLKTSYRDALQTIKIKGQNFKSGYFMLRVLPQFKKHIAKHDFVDRATTFQLSKSTEKLTPKYMNSVGFHFREKEMHFYDFNHYFTFLFNRSKDPHAGMMQRFYAIGDGVDVYEHKIDIYKVDLLDKANQYKAGEITYRFALVSQKMLKKHDYNKDIRPAIMSRFK